MINYYLLTKPGIVLGNLITVAAGFLLASKGIIEVWLFISALAGMTLIMASACILNNYIDRELDKKMARTKNRGMVMGLVSSKLAIWLAIALGALGFGVLYFCTNIVSLVVAGIGFFVYVFAYSLWKGHTIYGTAIGSIAGATPPVVGYCAASGQFDLGAIILFAMLVLWQMPHFFAIALSHLEDYRRAEIPVLPVSRGVEQTKVHMVIYIIAFIPTAMLLTFFNYTGMVYLWSALALGLVWLALSISGFFSRNDQRWGKQMFRFSLVLIMALSIIIPFDIA